MVDFFCCGRKSSETPSASPPKPRGTLGSHTINPVKSDKDPCWKSFFQAIGDFFKKIFCCGGRSSVSERKEGPTLKTKPITAPSSKTPPISSIPPFVAPIINSPASPLVKTIAPPQPVVINSIPSKETPEKKGENPFLSPLIEERKGIQSPGENAPKPVISTWKGDFLTKLATDVKKAICSAYSKEEIEALLASIPKELERGNTLIPSSSSMKETDLPDWTSWKEGLVKCLACWKEMSHVSFEDLPSLPKQLEQLKTKIDSAFEKFDEDEEETPSFPYGSLHTHLATAFTQLRNSCLEKVEGEHPLRKKCLSSLNEIASLLGVEPIIEQEKEETLTAYEAFVRKRKGEKLTPTKDLNPSFKLTNTADQFFKTLIEDVTKALKSASPQEVPAFLEYFEAEVQRGNELIKSFATSLKLHPPKDKKASDFPQWKQWKTPPVALTIPLKETLSPPLKVEKEEKKEVYLDFVEKRNKIPLPNPLSPSHLSPAKIASTFQKTFFDSLAIDTKEALCAANTLQEAEAILATFKEEIKKGNTATDTYLSEVNKTNPTAPPFPSLSAKNEKDIPGWKEWENQFTPPFEAWKLLEGFSTQTPSLTEVIYQLSLIVELLPQASDEKCPYATFGTLRSHLIFAYNSLTTSTITKLTLINQGEGIKDRDAFNQALEQIAHKLNCDPIKIELDYTEALKEDPSQAHRVYQQEHQHATQFDHSQASSENRLAMLQILQGRPMPSPHELDQLRQQLGYPLPLSERQMLDLLAIYVAAN